MNSRPATSTIGTLFYTPNEFVAALLGEDTFTVIRILKTCTGNQSIGSIWAREGTGKSGGVRTIYY